MANTAIYPETRLNDGPSTPKKITAIVVTIFFIYILLIIFTLEWYHRQLSSINGTTKRINSGRHAE